jgi:hypothetical protein
MGKHYISKVQIAAGHTSQIDELSMPPATVTAVTKRPLPRSIVGNPFPYFPPSLSSPVAPAPTQTIQNAKRHKVRPFSRRQNKPLGERERRRRRGSVAR